MLFFGVSGQMTEHLTLLFYQICITVSGLEPCAGLQSNARILNEGICFKWIKVCGRF